MSKAKICISIDTVLLAKLQAVMRLESRGSVSNTINALIEIDKYDFIEAIDKSDGLKFIATLKHYNPFSFSIEILEGASLEDLQKLHKPKK